MADEYCCQVGCRHSLAVQVRLRQRGRQPPLRSQPAGRLCKLCWLHGLPKHRAHCHKALQHLHLGRAAAAAMRSLQQRPRAFQTLFPSNGPLCTLHCHQQPCPRPERCTRALQLAHHHLAMPKLSRASSRCSSGVWRPMQQVRPCQGLAARGSHWRRRLRRAR